MREKATYTYCLVKTEVSEERDWYISDIPGLQAGDAVEVAVGSDEELVRGTVETMEEYAVDNVPCPQNSTGRIRRKVAADEFVSTDGVFLLSSGGKVLERYIGQTGRFETKTEGPSKIVIPEGVQEIRPAPFRISNRFRGSSCRRA